MRVGLAQCQHRSPNLPLCSFGVKLEDKAWPVAPTPVSQVSPEAGTALVRETPHCMERPCGIITGSPVTPQRETLALSLVHREG